jgi:hypothetical protein
LVYGEDSFLAFGAWAWADRGTSGPLMSKDWEELVGGLKFWFYRCFIRPLISKML